MRVRSENFLNKCLVFELKDSNNGYAINSKKMKFQNTIFKFSIVRILIKYQTNFKFKRKGKFQVQQAV